MGLLKCSRCRLVDIEGVPVLKKTLPFQDRGRGGCKGKRDAIESQGKENRCAYETQRALKL